MSGIIGGQNLWGSRTGIIGQTELDYEEGTWTVTANNTVTLYDAINLGSYTKVGRLVTCGGQVRVLSAGSPSTLSFNLPFASVAAIGEGANYYTGSIRIHNAAVPADVLWGIVSTDIGGTQLHVQGNKSSAPTVGFLATANAYYMFSITYMAA